MSVLEYVRVYLDGLLVLTNDSFEDHLQKPEVVLAKLLHTGLRVNAEKSTFCMNTIEYLGYLLTREGL